MNALAATPVLAAKADRQRHRATVGFCIRPPTTVT
jgi:hypothetical protein